MSSTITEDRPIKMELLNRKYGTSDLYFTVLQRKRNVYMGRTFPGSGCMRGTTCVAASQTLPPPFPNNVNMSKRQPLKKPGKNTMKLVTYLKIQTLAVAGQLLYVK